MAVAENKTSNIINCYNTGEVTASAYTSISGGIAARLGNSNSTLSNSYNTGKVLAGKGSGIIRYGGIAAQNGRDNTDAHYSIKITNTYCTMTSSSYSYYRVNSTYTTGRISDTTLQGYATTLGDAYTNDIQNEDGTWKYNNGYPILKWQLQENQVTE